MKKDNVTEKDSTFPNFLSFYGPITKVVNLIPAQFHKGSGNAPRKTIHCFELDKITDIPLHSGS